MSIMLNTLFEVLHMIVMSIKRSKCTKWNVQMSILCTKSTQWNGIQNLAPNRTVSQDRKD